MLYRDNRGKTIYIYIYLIKILMKFWNKHLTHGSSSVNVISVNDNHYMPDEFQISSIQENKKVMSRYETGEVIWDLSF